MNFLQCDMLCEMLSNAFFFVVHITKSMKNVDFIQSNMLCEILSNVYDILSNAFDKMENKLDKIFDISINCNFFC